MQLERLRQLFDFDLWANRRVLEDVRKAANPGESVRLFAHVLAAQDVWLARLNGRSSAGLAIWPERTLEECETEMERLAAAMRTFLDGATEESLSRELVYSNQSGAEFRQTPLDILTHVALHGQHHRGQILWELRKLGQDVRSADMILYLRE